MRAALDPRPPPQRPRAGLTLIELLLVMALLALIFGIGIGMFASLDLEDRTVVAEVESAIRSANNWATARAGPARVRIDREHGSIRAEGQTVIGTWHFESLPIRGAFDLEGSVFGATLDDDGFQGKSLSFTGAPGARAEIAVQSDPAYDFAEGFALACAIRPLDARGGRLVNAGAAWGLDLASGGALEGWFTAMRVDENGERKPAGKVVVAGPPGLLPLGSWTRVGLRYDRRALALLVEGVVVASTDETAEVAPLSGPLVLSDASRPFPGGLDSLVIGAIESGEEVLLPQSVTIAQGAPAEIAFAAGGGLDRAVHQRPVEVAIEFADGRRRAVSVSLHGTVR